MEGAQGPIPQPALLRVAMSHPNALYALSGDRESDRVIVSDEPSPSASAPTPSSRSGEDHHHNFVRSFPAQTANTAATATSVPAASVSAPASDDAAATADADAAAAAATYGCTATKLGSDESNSTLDQETRPGSPRRDSRKNLPIGGGGITNRGGGDSVRGGRGRGGPGGSIGSSMVARARGLLLQTSLSRSQEEEEDQETPREEEEEEEEEETLREQEEETPREHEEEKIMWTGQSFYRKACDRCSKVRAGRAARNATKV